MSQQGTMLSTIVCLLPLFSHLQPGTGETTGELLESVAKQTQNGSYNEIVCTFNVNVSLSRVDFVDNTGSEVFAIVDCGISCNVRSPYQDVLRIVSPEKTISGDRFVFNASHSDKTTGTYTCHGVTAPQVVYTTPSGTGDGDGDGHGEESQMTSAASPQTDESWSHNDGGSSNGLYALIIIPILLVLIGVVLFLHWWGVIQIPGLPKSRREPRDLRRIVGNLLQPVTGCWERTPGLWQPTRADNEDPLKHRESNNDQDEEACVENKQLLGHNEDKHSLHQDTLSFEDECNDGSKEEHPLLQDVHNNTKHTQDDNASVGDSQTSPQLSPNSTDTKDVDSDVDDRQTSPQSVHLSSSMKARDVAADLSAASLSLDRIQHKEESPHTTSHSSAPHDTEALTLKPAIATKPPHLKSGSRVVRNDSRPLTGSSVNGHKKSQVVYNKGGPSNTFTPKPRDAESENDDENKIKDIHNRDTPQTTSTRVETERGKQENMKGRLKPSPKTEGIKETEEREGQRASVDMKQKEESSETKSQTINNDDMKGQFTDQTKEDASKMKQREDDREKGKMREKETIEIKPATENEYTRQKQEGFEERMAEKSEQEDKEEAKREVEHAQKLEAEAVTEKTPDTRAETFKTGEEKEKGSNEDDETAFHDDEDRSRNTVDVDNLDAARQNPVYTDLSTPQDSQEPSEGEKTLQEARRKLKPTSMRK